MSRKYIDMRIDRLTVRGMAPRDAREIEPALARELERLVAEQGVPQQWTQGEPIQIPHVASRPGHGPARIGQSLARSIYRGGK